jgi:hypothetical protein
MAHNEDNNPNDDDDQHIHREKPSSPSYASSSPTRLIALAQQGSLGDGAPTHCKVH